jgi:hypothetical protein
MSVTIGGGAALTFFEFCSGSLKEVALDATAGIIVGDGSDDAQLLLLAGADLDDNDALPPPASDGDVVLLLLSSPPETGKLAPAHCAASAGGCCSWRRSRVALLALLAAEEGVLGTRRRCEPAKELALVTLPKSIGCSSASPPS